WPSEEHDMDTTLHTLVKAKEMDKARMVGVSNYTIELLQKARELTGNALATNQVEFHPFLDQRPLLRWMDDHDMFLTGYSPLCRGDVMDNETLQDIGEKYGKNPGQVTLRWALQHDERVAVIPKSSNPDHIESNFDVFDFELSQEEMMDITNLARPDGRKVDPDFAPEWDTPRKAA
ncbi:MAG: aldo/keto reductase, partial [Alphaproteobacteria bacterium]